MLLDVLSAAHSDTAPGAARAALIEPSAADEPSFRAAWADLSQALVEENPFFEPWTLTPALAAYADKHVRLACVWSGARLIALAPVRKRVFYARLPLSYWAIWTHPHCYYGAPLIRAGEENEALAALFKLLGEGADARGFIRFGRIDRDGPVAAAIHDAAAQTRRTHYEAGALERAILFGGATAEATLAVHVRKKKRKELKRLRARLEEVGAVRVRELSDDDDLDAWVAAFLDLENDSWKGKAKTSLKSSEEDARWFAGTLAGAHAVGKLHFMRIDLDGRPIAMLASLLSNGAGYSLKICHDTDLARYSLGVMIEIEAMKTFLERDDFRFADSCAAPDHSMINGLWRSRRVVTGINVSTRRLGARAGLAFARALEGARARLPGGARHGL